MATRAKDRYDLNTYNNVDYQRDFVFKDNGVLRPWAGYSAKLQVKQTETSPALITLTDVSGIQLGPSDGLLTITIPKADLLALSAGSYRYDLVLAVGGVSSRAFGGFLVVSTGITV